MNYDLKEKEKQTTNTTSVVESMVKLIHSELHTNVTNLDGNNLDLIVQSMIPSQIFIMPQKVNIASSN